MQMWKENTLLSENPASQVLTNALWYITNQHDTINDRARREKEVLGVPPEFDKFKNYNDLKKKRQKLGTLEATQMKTCY